LTKAYTHMPVAIAHYHQRGEAEAASALHHFRGAAQLDNLFLQVQPLGVNALRLHPARNVRFLLHLLLLPLGTIFGRCYILLKTHCSTFFPFLTTASDATASSGKSRYSVRISTLLRAPPRPAPLQHRGTGNHCDQTRPTPSPQPWPAPQSPYPFP